MTVESTSSEAEREIVYALAEQSSPVPLNGDHKNETVQAGSIKKKSFDLSRPTSFARGENHTKVKPFRKEHARTVELMGITGFLTSVAGWIALVYFPIGFLQAALFVVGAGLAALSMRKMSAEPGKYLLKTFSFVALLLSLIGLAVMLYAGLIYLLS